MIGRALRSLQLRLLDAVDRVTGRADRLVPPRRLNFVGDSDFIGTGEEFMCLFVELAELRPDERVLDVGSGIGRMARPLAGYLRPPGSYEGFDIVPEGVSWCQDHYRHLDHFRFRLAEVRNTLYRPDAGVPASEYVFPYPDATFDFAFATSVFTHLLPDDADRYLEEIARVTKPSGRVLLTFFVLDAATDLPASGRLSFAHRHEHHAIDSEAVPEAAVAYREEWIRERLGSHGLAPSEPLGYGKWSGRADGLSFQDIVLARPIKASTQGAPHGSAGQSSSR